MGKTTFCIKARRGKLNYSQSNRDKAFSARAPPICSKARPQAVLTSLDSSLKFKDERFSKFIRPYAFSISPSFVKKLKTTLEASKYWSPPLNFTLSSKIRILDLKIRSLDLKTIISDLKIRIKELKNCFVAQILFYLI